MIREILRLRGWRQSPLVSGIAILICGYASLGTSYAPELETVSVTAKRSVRFEAHDNSRVLMVRANSSQELSQVQVSSAAKVIFRRAVEVEDGTAGVSPLELDECAGVASGTGSHACEVKVSVERTSQVGAFDVEIHATATGLFFQREPGSQNQPPRVLDVHIDLEP